MTTRKKKRKKNTAPPLSRRYVIQHTKGNLRLLYDGVGFSDDKKPATFKTEAGAYEYARMLLAHYPRLRLSLAVRELAPKRRRKNPLVDDGRGGKVYLYGSGSSGPSRGPRQKSGRRQTSRQEHFVPRTAAEAAKLSGTAAKSPIKNPSVREGLAQASERLKNFSGHKATEVLRVNDRNPKTGLVIGSLDGVLYTTTRDGKVEKYIHRFRRKSRPLLAASSDGKSLKIVGGRFEFTEAGIEDR
jgi:hypothetical protein